MPQIPNQLEIIDKFTKLQHLCLLENSPEIDISNGMCNALSHLFLELSEEAFQDLIFEISLWDGDPSSVDDEIRTAFTLLHDTCLLYQIRLNENGLFCIGEGLVTLLQERNDSLVLSNQKHAISIQPCDNQRQNYFIYDPNSGIKIVSHSDVVEHVRKCIGTLLYVDENPNLSPVITNCSDFIKQGGLHALARSANAIEILEKLNQVDIHSLESSTLDGLFQVDAREQPAWLVCSSNNTVTPEINQYIENLIETFIAREPTTALNQLAKSMALLKNKFSLLDATTLQPELKKQIFSMLSQPSAASNFEKAAQLPKQITELREQMSKLREDSRSQSQKDECSDAANQENKLNR